MLKEHPYAIGKNYFFRSVTHYYTGKLLAVYEHELVIENAAWVADTGRFGQMLKTGSLKEVEPYPDGEVVLGRGALVDAIVITFPLPRDTK